ncbi:hypothetical protein DRF65_12740 [Chryseobacterium pennae]|uniref:Uncharacterized protein n=1 Tax=Chryseobacterium pennae TaxID=2258962 RepID=A0A3D9C7M5_9FLAO|nr:hypothetical protein [Chryseobacterium pennae]REC61890.1 hypothetical protein DRF65_12740 [Chryseobacterium pennae]
MENLTIPISLLFGIITFVTLLLFCWAIKNSASAIIKSGTGKIFLILLCWLIIQAALSLNDVYNSHLNSLPPKIVLLGILPPVLVILFMFNTPKGKLFIDSLSLLHITYLNIIRIFVEIALYKLFLYKMVPEIMTFKGINFDILAGISAPFIAYYGIRMSKISRNLILYWHIIGLALLLNIVIIALLSAPSPLQRIAFDQPNIAILHFPFSWLPTFIVPVVLFGHLVSIRQLLRQKQPTPPQS